MFLVSRIVLVLVQRALGRADHRDDQARVVHRVDPAAEQRVVVQVHAGRGAVGVVRPVARAGAVLGHEDVLHPDAVGPGGVHPDDVAVAPVVEHGDVLDRRADREQALGLAAGDERVAHEVGRVPDPGAVVPLTLDEVPAVDRGGGAHRGGPVRALEVPGRAEQLDLPLLGEPGADARARGARPGRAPRRCRRRPRRRP